MLQVIQVPFEYNIPCCANLSTEYTSYLVPGVIMSYPFYNHCGHEPNSGELLWHVLVCELQHIPKDSGICVIWFLFLSWKSLNQRCSETPQFATNRMDIRGLYSPDGDRWLLGSLTCTRTCQPGGFAGFDETGYFQYLVMLYGLFCLWSHLDILLPFVDVLPVFEIYKKRDILPAPFRKWASME